MSNDRDQIGTNLDLELKVLKCTLIRVGLISITRIDKQDITYCIFNKKYF